MLSRVRDNARALKNAHRSIAASIREDKPITPGAEWLIDNFHIVEDQVREIIDDLPPSYYRKLPKLADGFLKEFPRVYGIAWAFIAHTDSRLDPEWLNRFVRAYQRVETLAIGEIWALPISLRMALVENLRRLADRITEGKNGRAKADALADALIRLKTPDSRNGLFLVRPFEGEPLQRSFAVQLVQRLRDQDERVAPVLLWLDKRLAEQGTTAEDIVRLEHQDQTAMNATVRNIITSMRSLSSMDWTEFFEAVSAVDAILRSESEFGRMDFATRDMYRHAIEQLSAGSGLPEEEVTRQAIRAARKAAGGYDTGSRTGANDRRLDPGYYLIADGRQEFERSLGCRVPLGRRLFRAFLSGAVPTYLGAVAIVTFVALAVPFLSSGLDASATTALIGILALLPASNLALAIVNRLVTRSMGPRPLPKLDFSSGVPKEHRTLVVVPVLLSRAEAVQEYVERLETHYLSNPDGYVQLALLSDWVDAPNEHRSDDAPLLAKATEGVKELNARYGPGPDDLPRFLLLHRRRTWNPADGVWMGWERKRGKLHELNRLLRGDEETTYTTILPGQAADLRDVRYVITLDSDTRLSRGAVNRLAGAMAHPLNRPRFDPVSRRVVEGYGIMQPRITPTLPMTGTDEASLHQWIFSGPAGIDPYAFAVSDVYQDLFHEGSFVGKGIYDPDAVESALNGRVPENTVLSHDLFEGLFARAALVTDIELFEEFPMHYEVASDRNHRWVRGDWQLLPWILGRLAWSSGLPAISRWKMVDNLRRSLSPIAMLLTLVAAWTLPGVPVAVWTLFVLAVLGIPPLSSVLSGLIPRRRQMSLRHHLSVVGHDVRLAAWHIALAVIFLGHQSWQMGDAVLRTLFRMLISRHRLLEWTSAAQLRRRASSKLGAFFWNMIDAPVVSVALFLLVLTTAPHNWRIAGLFSLLWFLSPLAAYFISRPVAAFRFLPLAPADRQYLRLIGRKTWRYFETFVSEAHHYLPPDNYQETPSPVVANRTSPTNIGLYLLSVTVARDFGWTGILETTRRLEETLATVQALPRHQGHLFNWYDTRDLRPLQPLYISTVDSGNLAGHLWAVAQACRQMPARPIFSPDVLEGLEDTLKLVEEAAVALGGERPIGVVTPAHWEESISLLRESLRTVPQSMAEWGSLLSSLRGTSATLLDIARTLAANTAGAPRPEFLHWADALFGQIDQYWNDFDLFFGWLGLPAAARAKVPEPRSLADILQAVSSALIDPTPENTDLRDRLTRSRSAAHEAIERLRKIAQACDDVVAGMDFGFLFDPLKKIFSIGFQVGERKLDDSYYDLLASEARLASFVAIAKGDVPSLHWFRLNRSLVSVEHGLALVSWSGSMFEYLMPSLVMRSPKNSLIGNTLRQIVRRQISYGAERGTPWGISESAYNVQNLERTYQYSNFGVPGLGLKRGLAKDMLVAPYATALAAMVDSQVAADNFRSLAALGSEGAYGFYESLDFTVERLPEGQTLAVVQAYMAHHQGMTLVAIGNVLREEATRHRFHSNPLVQATELLLQERVPRTVTAARVRAHDTDLRVREPVPVVLRRFLSPHDQAPRTHLLSNGRYTVMITAAGSGYSRCADKAVTRWREDVTRDNFGTYVFLRDVENGDVWSAGYQPAGSEPDRYQVDFAEDRAEISRQDGDIETTLEVIVSPQDDAELRRVTLRNNGPEVREIDATSYAEIVLATQAADEAHPAFSNLFVRTEFIPGVNGLVCTRRPRSPEEPPQFAAHVVVVDGETAGSVQYESDRARFLGRGRGVRTPMCVIDGKPLSNTVGTVIDPIVSLRQRVRLEPGQSSRITFSTMVASSREDVLMLADKYHDPAMFERTATLAWTHAHVQQSHLGLSPAEAHLFQDLASRLIYAQPALRPSSSVLAQNTLGAPGLWPFGISGDLPIALVRIDAIEDAGIVRDVLRAHEYWRMKNLAVDVVVMNEKAHSYAQELQGHLENLVRSVQGLRGAGQGPQGGTFILRADQLSIDQRVLLRTAARVTINSRQGTLAEQIQRLEQTGETPSASMPPEREKRAVEPVRPEPGELQFFNGLGGFSSDGREYVTTLGAGQWTPAPWVNVVANPNFGFQASESGAGYTWSVNSRENQLTPWSNDAVGDPPGEIFYVRDEDSGEVWTPTVLPIREEAWPYTARHGQGYSRFEHTSHGIALELLQYVPLEDPIKISRLALVNTSNHSRRLSVTAYIEWVLGSSRATHAPFIITEMDGPTGAMMARNPWNGEFADRVSFADLGGHQTAWTADRTEVLGRNGTLDHPMAIEQGIPLSGRVGAGLDACVALQRTIRIEPGERVEIVFCLGQADGRDAARDLIHRYRSADLDEVLAAVKSRWDDVLGGVQVKTPDRSMDLMLNRWLLYQTLSCRLWARGGFYQAGGAFGFRDQLQDVLALLVSQSRIAREQILRAASRQFPEGDVQHWWHPPSGRGVRTRISDDRAWLPFVVTQYIEVTGDEGVLDEVTPFLDGNPIPSNRDDLYHQPRVSATSATVFEHCARALDRSLAVGAHGLPLMGTGDWNDGMNRVGHEGKGESVWLAWFLHTTLWEFAKLAEKRGEHHRAKAWRLHVARLKAAVERHGWDGDWYRRAFFDDGTPLGSNAGAECRIDSIAQTWSVLSGAADPARARQAMEAVRTHLLRPEDGLLLIFAPPFERMKPSPGYVQGYLPGVRENGGQYTHAAAWAIFAFAALGDGDTANQLFSLLNPVNHGSSRAAIHRYKVEPYVMAGDVYAGSQQSGRGGWTWYTGSAGWMYRAGLEAILGFQVRKSELFMDPCVPPSWKEFEIAFRYRSTRYAVLVTNSSGLSRGVASIEMEGRLFRAGAGIPLVDDGGVHRIRIELGPAADAQRA